MKRTHDLMVSTGTYQKEGQKKTRWQKVGVILSDGQRTSVKMESTPIQTTDKNGNLVPWDGWLQAFEPRNDSDPVPF